MGLNLMKNALSSLLLIGTLVSAYSAAQPEQAKQTAPVKKTAPLPAVVDDTPVEALQVGGSVVVLKTAAGLGDPDSAAWREAQEYRMELGLAPPVHPSINLRYDATTPPAAVFLRAATDGERLYLRLRWPDASQNMASNRSEFADGVAVQFALGDSATTSFMMGAPAGPVNIWYWKAGQAQAQNLAAGGFGSTTALEPAGLNASSLYRDSGEWVVVFSRPLDQAGEHQVQLQSVTASIALALWQGDGKQRDGLKHVSMGWVSLAATLAATGGVPAS